MSLRRSSSFAGLLIIEILVLVTMATAQNTVRVNAIDTKGFPRGKAYLSVLEKGIEPLQCIHSEDFTIYEDQIPISNPSIELFKDSNEGVSIVVVVDSGGSVKGEALKNAKKSIRNLASELRPKDYMALVSFNDNVKFASFESIGEGKGHFTGFKNDEPLTTGSFFTNDHREFSKAVDEIMVGGRISVLYRAIIRAAQILGSARTTYKCVFVLSDGHNEDPTSNDIDSCIQTIRKLRVPVFAIGVGWGKSNWLQYMRRIGYETGAIYRHVSDSDKLGSAYHNLKQILMNQYVLSFRFGNTQKDGNIHELVVSVKIADRKFLQRVSFRTPLDTSREVKTSASIQPLEKANAALASNSELACEVTQTIAPESFVDNSKGCVSGIQSVKSEWKKRSILYISVGVVSVITILAIYRIVIGLGGVNEAEPNTDTGNDVHWKISKGK